MKPGWWAENVDPALDASQVLVLVGRDAPEHPALPRLRRAAEGFEKARSTRDERLFRCFMCKDVGWVELDVSGRGTMERCRGPRNAGCPADEERRQRAVERGARDGKKSDGEGAAL